jgi:tRNA (cytidine32/uridine32-2'-O)-methyltransferase
MLDNIQIVLVNTTHPGNIGATARAMKTMGLKNLILAKPFAKFPSADITARAAGADSVLEQARVTESLAEAVVDCSLVIGTSAEERSLPLKRLTARECAEYVCTQPVEEKIAIVFGTERSGMSNEELALCHRQVVIPTSPDYTSLNLAAAVQVICYEVFMAGWAANRVQPAFREEHDRLATTKELDDFYRHLEQTLIDIRFIEPHVDKKIMPRLQRLFNRTGLERKEINLLRGILNAAGDKK